MHQAIIIGTVRSLIVDVAMGQIPRSTERISSKVMDSHVKVTGNISRKCSFPAEAYRPINRRFAAVEYHLVLF